MKLYEKLLKEHGLIVDEIEAVTREIRLETLADIFNKVAAKHRLSGNYGKQLDVILDAIHEEFDDDREEYVWKANNLEYFYNGR